MSDQLTPDFYGANRWNPYPFTGPHDDFTAAVIDASISTARGQQGLAVTLTDFSISGHIEVKVGTETLVALTDIAGVSSFGDYDIWEFLVAEGQVTLVLLRAAISSMVFTGPYEFVPGVISYGPEELVLSMVVDTTEAAGPGENLTLLRGPNINFEVETDPLTGNSTITVNAAFDPTQPCSPESIVRLPGIRTINGVPPDSNGNFFLGAKGIWLVGKVPGAKELRVSNIGAACCDCQDYEEFFELLRGVVEGLQTPKDNLELVQDAYKQLLAYIRFLLQTQSIGGVLPGETNRLA